MNKREADSLPYKIFSLRRGGYYPPAVSIKFNLNERRQQAPALQTKSQIKQKNCPYPNALHK